MPARQTLTVIYLAVGVQYLMMLQCSYRTILPGTSEDDLCLLEEELYIFREWRLIIHVV
ncbi:hypothetical protein K503DRAFT_566184 [Rhizopogon vinicolor AM-OR11-026]|uniref:Uncharacterized protein n=1 Tax=Rhizopogon vinicolor AM-OR11-026 TaxID=1314800 RepID=A0A1B7MK16_9AGAM|nr:hypothetical protein K503DRAFT_566184 [Rhizopogon vinicolor AM-OR11-026]